MQDEADEAGEPSADGTFASKLRHWRGKRSRREVGEALVAALAELPEDERDRTVGQDHIRLWEQGRAGLPVLSTQRALAAVLGVPARDVMEVVGWEQIRAAGAHEFVWNLLQAERREGAQEQADQLTKAEVRLLVALRALEPSFVVSDLARVLEALKESVDPPSHLQAVYEAAGIRRSKGNDGEAKPKGPCTPEEVAGWALSYLAMMPPAVQQALWWRFLGTDIIPAVGMCEEGLAPHVVLSRLSAEAHFAALNAPRPGIELLKADAAARWDEEKGEWREDVPSTVVYDRSARDWVKREEATAESSTPAARDPEAADPPRKKRRKSPSEISREQTQEAFEKAKRSRGVAPTLEELHRANQAAELDEPGDGGPEAES